MDRKHLEEIADSIDIEFKDISDENLLINIKKEIKSMYISLEEHAKNGTSTTHPELNTFDSKEIQNCVNFLYNLRVEFDLLKDTNENPDIVKAQLEMHDILNAFYSEDFEQQDREFQNRFLERLDQIRNFIEGIDSVSYDLKKLKFDCMAMSSLILLNHNFEDFGVTGLEGLFENEKKK